MSKGSNRRTFNKQSDNNYRNNKFWQNSKTKNIQPHKEGANINPS